MSDLSRKEFLEEILAGAAIGAGALGLAGCSKTDPYAIPKPPVPGSEHWYLGQEKWIQSTCAQCPAGCGIRVRVVQGRVVKIEGNTNSPVNQGGLGPKGQSGPYVLYDPDRITKPLKRKGAKGSGQWEEISWDQAAKEVSEQLKSVREKGNPHQLAVMSGRPRGLMVELLKRFCLIFGTPNYFDSFSASDGAMLQAMNLSLGADDLPGNDWINTTYVLSLGAGLFETTCQGIFFARQAALMRQAQAVHRAKIVQVEPAYSMTALQTDEWIPIFPGTYDALALGISHILVKENLYDKSFVEKHTFGFKEWKDAKGVSHKGFSDILEDYPPDKVSGITGIPTKDIVRIAHEMAKYPPAFAAVDARSTATSNGLHIARCALALNALLGSIHSSGGLLVQQKPPLKKWPEPKLDSIAKSGLRQPRLDSAGMERFPFSSSVAEIVPEQILEGKPYPIQAMLVYYTNPLYSRISPDRFRKAFEKIPLVVSFSPFMDETSFYADYVLPDHTYLERWEDGTPNPTVGYPIFGIRRPAVDPLYDTKNTGDVLIQIAKTIGGNLEAGFPWEDFKGALDQKIAGLFESKKGLIKAPDQEAFLDSLKKEGFWAEPPYDFKEWRKIFNTPSGKFEFYSQVADKSIKKCAAASKKQISELLEGWEEENLDMACLPHAKNPEWTGDSSKYPFYFVVYRPITYAEGSGANLPWLQNMGNTLTGVRWDSWAEISPKAAGDLGIQDGDLITVESPVGKIKTHARLRAQIPPNLIRMAEGQGHTQMGRYARGKGANPKEVLAVHADPFSGIAPTSGTRVKVVKA